MPREIATSHMSRSDIDSAEEAIAWFQLYISSDQRFATQELAAKHIRNLKHFCRTSRSANLDRISEAKEIHYTLEVLIARLENQVN